ncbi:MAG: hypothetical protein GAK45_00433 [Pseudomonas citronellolis]|nr:MAG: hypothetical protein GAK45_00433 [Pseudomonas citronellolis]
MKHRIIESPAFHVVGLRQRSDTAAESIVQLWQRFQPHVADIVPSEAGVSYGVCSHGASGLVYLAGLPVSADAAVPEGMQRIEVPAQKYAVFTHLGTVERLADSFQVIHDSLLQRIGLTARPGISLERYDARFLGGIDPASQVDLYIPIY